MRQMDNPTDAVNELMARIEHAPKSVQSLDPTIPDDVDRIVTRCLQPNATARFQSVQELRTALDAVYTAAGVTPPAAPCRHRGGRARARPP